MTKRFLILLSVLSTFLNQIECMESENWQEHFGEPYVENIDPHLENIREADLRKKLIRALDREDLRSFKELIESNHIDINTNRGSSKPSGFTAFTIFGEVIDHALKNRNSEFVEYLLQHGADLNEPSYFNLTPLEMVVERVALEPQINHDKQFLLKLINLLLDAGARINEKTLEFVMKKSFKLPFYKDVLEIFEGNMSGQEAMLHLVASDKLRRNRPINRIRDRWNDLDWELENLRKHKELLSQAKKGS